MQTRVTDLATLAPRAQWVCEIRDDALDLLLYFLPVVETPDRWAATVRLNAHHSQR